MVAPALCQVIPLEQATQHLLLAQSVSSLYQCYIRLSGEDVEDSPHAKDMVSTLQHRMRTTFLQGYAIHHADHIPFFVFSSCACVAGTSETL